MKPLFAATLGCMVSLLACAPLRAQSSGTTQSETFTGVYDPTLVQNDGVVVYGATVSGTFAPAQHTLFTTSPASSTTYTETIQVPNGATGMEASVFSVYDTTNNYVTLALSSAAYSAALNQPFDMVFTDSNYMGTAYNNEATLAGAIESDNATYLETFFTLYKSDFPTVSGTTPTGDLINFSNGSYGGTATLTVSPAPEPSTWAVIGAGAAGLLILRRRRALRA